MSSTDVSYTSSPKQSDNYTTPLIVFVHGWTDQQSRTWSDMYRTIPFDKYRCVFVNLKYCGSSRTNGQDFADLLVKITGEFAVSKVVVVAHSKGGIDVQAAILYNSADVHIERVVTLSTPHWGSPLSDLLYSPLVNKIPAIKKKFKGKLCDATSDMRTSEMTKFRNAFDSDPRASSVPFLTVAGNGTDDDRSILNRAQRGFMDSYGQNDDMVTVSMAKKPGAVDLGTLPYGHKRMNEGPVWTVIEPFLTAAITNSSSITPVTYRATSSDADMLMALPRAGYAGVMSSSRLKLIVGVSLGIVAVLILGLIVYYFYYRKRRSSRYLYSRIDSRLNRPLEYYRQRMREL